MRRLPALACAAAFFLCILAFSLVSCADSPLEGSDLLTQTSTVQNFSASSAPAIVPEPEAIPLAAMENSWELYDSDPALARFVDRTIEIARNEPPFPVDKTGATIYGTLFSQPQSAWCAEFIMYCLTQAQEELGVIYLEDGFSYNRYPISDSSYVLGQWYITWDRYFPVASGYRPSRGDLILFDCAGAGFPDHVAFCTGVEEVDGVFHVTTIEGNIPGDKPSQIRERSLPLDDPALFAYCSLLTQNPEPVVNYYIPEEKDNEEAENGGESETEGEETAQPAPGDSIIPLDVDEPVPLQGGEKHAPQKEHRSGKERR